MTNTCFTKKYSRKFTIVKLARWPIEWLLHKISKYHIADNRKQVAVFAFDHIAHSINIQGVYEKEELDVFFDWMSKLNTSFSGKLAIDIGANIGNHSLYFSDYFQNVHSFEPNPRTFNLLSINSNLAHNIICHKIGLSDVSRNSQIKVNVGNIGNSMVVDGVVNGTIGISLETLDSFNFKKVGLIKIDVEGHEYKALLGAKKND
jgi:FkbM family methyltransferase